MTSLRTAGLLLAAAISTVPVHLTGQTGAGHAWRLHPGSDYVLQTWTTEDGLPQNSVNDILQTSDGYIWLATFGGVARFDGARFVVFDRASSPDLASNRALTLHEDRQGALWIGLQSGVLARYRDSRFESFDADSLTMGADIWDLDESSDGSLWVASTRRLIRREPNGTVTRYSAPDGSDVGISRLLIENDTVLMASAVGVFRVVDGALEHHPGYPREKQPGMAHGFTRDSSGRLWLTTGSGQWILDEDGHFEEVATARQVAEWGAMSDPDGALWLFGEELYRVPAEDLGALRPGPWPDLPPLLERSPFGIVSAVTDHEGNTWFGSRGAGLLRLAPKPLEVHAKEAGLPVREVTAVLPDESGGALIGGCDGLVRFDGARFRSTGIGDPGPSCAHPLARGPHGELWFLLNDRLARLRDGVITRFEDPTWYGPQPPGSALPDADGSLWFPMPDGLGRIVADTLLRYPAPDGTARGGRILHRDRNGVIWIGADGAVIRFDRERYTRFGPESGMPNGEVRTFHEDEHGSLWIGTYGAGLAHHAGGRFTSITREDGLFDNVVSQILPDDRGHLWFNGNIGLFGVLLEELHAFVRGEIDRVFSIAYTAVDGYPEGNGGIHPAARRSGDGSLWFPTIDGIVVLDPATRPVNDVPPPVVIEGVSTADSLLPLSARIDVPPLSRQLEIDYTALSFAHPDRVRFRYRLLGYDNEWIDAGNRRTAFYTSVPPGEYTFHVVASNDQGVWNEIGASLAIRMLPPFWATLWFRGGALLAFLVATGSAVRYRTRSVRRRNQTLLIEIAERNEARAERESLIEELEAKNAELERFTYTVSHDLKTPLVTIKGFVGLLERDLASQDSEAARNDAEHIKAAAERMQRLLDELLELSRIGRLADPVEDVSIAEVVSEALELVRGVIDRRGVSVHVAPDLPIVRGDRVRLSEVLQNLVENAVKFMGDQERPRIEIGWRAAGERPVFYVADNGIGVDPRHHDKIFGLFDRLSTGGEGTGIGLALVRRIVETHGGEAWIESEGVGRGSTVCFTLGG